MKNRVFCALLILALLLPCAGLAEQNALAGTAWQGIDRDTFYTLTFRDGTPFTRSTFVFYQEEYAQLPQVKIFLERLEREP